MFHIADIFGCMFISFVLLGIPLAVIGGRTYFPFRLRFGFQYAESSFIVNESECILLFLFPFRFKVVELRRIPYEYVV